MGTVKDYSGLDGCKFLIETEAGKKLLPAKVNDENFKFKDGQKIRFDYEVDTENSMSICMAEDMIVEITCIEVVNARAIQPECKDIAKAENSGWLMGLINKYGIFRIQKFEEDGIWLYYLEGGPRNYLYNCRGELICDVPGKMINDCYRRVSKYGSGEVIFVKEGPSD